jgi:hypothetical protein
MSNSTKYLNSLIKIIESPLKLTDNSYPCKIHQVTDLNLKNTIDCTRINCYSCVFYNTAYNYHTESSSAKLPVSKSKVRLRQIIDSIKEDSNDEQ